MACSWGAIYFASVTVFDLLFSLLIGFNQVLLKLLGVFSLQKGLPWDDARVAALSEVQEQKGDGNGDKENYGYCRADCPNFLEHEDSIGNHCSNDTSINIKIGEGIFQWSCNAPTAKKSIFPRPSLMQFRHRDSRDSQLRLNQLISQLVNTISQLSKQVKRGAIMTPDMHNVPRSTWTKLIYILALVVILFAFLFYLNMIKNSNLFEAVSVILGFTLCLLLQMRLISYYHSDEMAELGLDEFGIVKEKMCKLFGYHNLNHINIKYKTKYYFHSNLKSDPLFNENNEDLYDCIMTKLRGHNEIDHFTRIKHLKGKWNFFLNKISAFESFLNSLSKMYKDRFSIFKNFYQKNIGKISSREYQKWCILFQTNPQNETKTPNAYGYSPNLVNWEQMNYLIEQRMKMNDSKTSQIFKTVLNEFNIYTEEMRTQRKERMDKMALVEQQYGNCKKKYREIVEKIDQTKEKIDEVMKGIKQNAKNQQNVETIYNNEYELRMLSSEIDNLEVRKTYQGDMCSKQSEQLYQLCSSENSWIDNSAFKSFDNKLLNYLQIMFEQQKFVHSKLLSHKAENHLNETDADILKGNGKQNFEQVFEKYTEVQRRSRQFQLYLIELTSLHTELISNFNKTDDIIQGCQNHVDQQNKDEKEDISNVCVSDSFFLSIIRSITKREIKTMDQSRHILQKQSQAVQHRDDLLKTTKASINNLNEKLKNMKLLYNGSAVKKKESKGPNLLVNQQMEISFNNLQSQMHAAYRVYISTKIMSYLHDDLDVLLNSQYEIYTFISEKKEKAEQKMNEESSEDPREMKRKLYNDELFKMEMKDRKNNGNRGAFHYSENEKNAEQQEQTNSFEIINRLLGVFFEEWSHSEFFHEFIKEELEVTFNKKRPEFLNYVSLKHIKLHEKYGDILESIQFVGENEFVCCLDIMVTFHGKIALHLETQLRGPTATPINIKILIKQFVCPLRVCLNPFTLGMSYVCFQEIPSLSVEYCASFGGWDLTKIPFLSQIIKTVIIIKFRKKFVEPKRNTISIPLSVHKTLELAIRERLLFQRQMEKKKKML